MRMMRVMRKIKIGKVVVPLWFIIVFLVSIVGVSSYYVWQTLTIQLGSLNYSEFEPYAVNMAYSTYGCATIKNNETSKERLVKWIDSIQSIGFKGVGVAELECYYMDDYLTDYLDLLQNRNLNVAIYFMWRDFTITNFTFGEPHAILREFWMPKDFPDNSTKAYEWVEWIENITKITKDYSNVQFYFLFMPFRWAGEHEANFENQTGYRFFMQLAVNTIKQWDSKPILLVSDGIEMENKSLIPYIPYDLANISGYGFTFYSRIRNGFSESAFKEMYDLYQSKIDTYLNGSGYLFIPEWGWQTTNFYVYGYCQSENDKVVLLTQTIKTFSKFKIKYWGYFAIQDFPSENADFGLVDDAFNLKQSGIILRELIS